MKSSAVTQMTGSRRERWDPRMIYGRGSDSWLRGSGDIVQSHVMFKADGSPRSPEVIQVMTGRSTVEDGQIPRMPSVIFVVGSLPARIKLIGFPRLIILPRKKENLETVVVQSAIMVSQLTKGKERCKKQEWNHSV